MKVGTGMRKGTSLLILTAVLVGAVVAGCGKQNSNPDNISGAPTTVGNNPTAMPQTNSATIEAASSPASTGSFDGVASTWSRVETARAELDTAIKAKKLDQAHEACSKIRDFVKTLPYESSMLSEDRRKTLDAHVKNVGELAAMMDKFNDPNDMKSAQEHQTAMNDALDMIKGIYPPEAMRSYMHMPAMSSSGKNMSDDSMPGKPMGDKMSGMGTPADPGKTSGMSGMGTPADPGTTSGMGGMGMMDKMMSGMSDMDKGDMKMMMDKMMAMPPAQRKKAMKKMSGMGTPADPGKMSGDM